MERIKFIVKCNIIKKDVNVTYFIDPIKNSDGTLKKKAVQYFNCEGKEQCDSISNIMDCTCFRKIRNIEVGLNTSLTLPR